MNNVKTRDIILIQSVSEILIKIKYLQHYNMMDDGILL